jgi:TolA-binding protein
MTSDSSDSPTAPDDAPVPPNGTPPSLDEVRVQGLEDGRSGVDSTPYESFLALSVARDRIQDALTALQKRLDGVESALDEVRSLRRNLASATTALEELEAERDEAEQALNDVETSLEAVQEEQTAKRDRGSVLYAVLYSVAGLLFVGGDVIMSREIVASALKIRGEVESWIFALALAMLAVLLKPAYDRLVERQYWAGRPRLFAGVISVCALGALSTLWILGAFRSSAFASSTRIQRLTAQLTETSDPAAIQEIQASIRRLQQDLIDGPLAYWAFALSGVLFAVAGAVCLGIGFAHIRGAYHLRYRLYRAHRRFAAKRDRLSATIDDLNEQIREHRVRIEEMRQALSDAEPLDVLRARRDDLQERREALRNERAEVHSHRLQSLYRQGVQAGQGEADPPPGDGAPPPDPKGTSADPDDNALDSYVGIRPLLPHSSSS